MTADRRTTVDFSKHIILETHLKSDNHNIDIWDMKLPESEYTNRVRFINSCGTMTVNGDFGNWVFTREFHPSNGGGVSGGYWDEKLEIGSVQKSKNFCSKETIKDLQLFKENLSELENTEEMKDWIKELENSVEDEYEYTHKAYRENPCDIDYEYIPFGETRHTWLNIIYDAFDELCSRQPITLD